MDTIEYAKSFIGTPYIWAANGAGAFDCSGFVCEILRMKGRIDRKDYTSNGLLRLARRRENEYLSLDSICLVFFGRVNATHVAIKLNENYMIECGGGNRSTQTATEARKKNAMVRIRRIDSRNDFLATFYI